ncbi:MAG TPA: hypothetical protein P5244_08950 [Syntrophales bacterium]|nr:hypothetical protein [Syntrophales bacterium]
MIAEIIPKIAGQFAEEEQGYHPRPSMAGPERCIRQMVYHALGIERRPFPGRALLVFDDGRWHEELSLDWLRKSAFQVNSEQMLINISFPGFGLSLIGHIDALLTDILGNDYLLEHKAINHFTFQRYWDGQLPLDYITQVCLYLRGLQAVNPELRRAILLIKNKNTAAYLEFLIEYDQSTDLALIIEMTDSSGEKKTLDAKIENICRDAFTKFQTVEDYCKKRTLPKRQYFIDDWHCDYCGWAAACWENYKEEFKALSEDVALSEEIETMARYYKELGAQKSDIEKEYKALSEKVREALKAVGAREGRAGEYILKLSLIEKKRIDPELLTDMEREKATVTSFYERLNVSAPKRKERKENG